MTMHQQHQTSQNKSGSTGTPAGQPRPKQCAHDRLCSICHDVEQHVKPILKEFPWCSIWGNERCGSWYSYPVATTKKQQQSCYFKSTDGHVGTWALSLKRLNLHLISSLYKQQQERKKKHVGCIILDASARKEMPDSMSRTIPIWAAVMNRIAVRFRDDFGLPPVMNWDTNLYTPPCITEDEHARITELLDQRVEELYESGAIVNPKRLVETLVKPLRPKWRTAQSLHTGTNLQNPHLDQNYFYLVCVSCSSLSLAATLPKEKIHNRSFVYVPGAADDHETWARKLTPQLFWDHLQEILPSRDLNDGEENKEATTDLIDFVVTRNSKDDSHDQVLHPELFQKMGETSIYLGSRRAGKPPGCWDHFDAILNVTAELDYFHQDTGVPSDKFYLQLPVQEGKRDKRELERWLPIGLIFIFTHAFLSRRKVLIHCAQGKDRSVAVVLAAVVLLSDLKDPLCFRSDVHDNVFALANHKERQNETTTFYKRSGIPNPTVELLLGQKGKEELLKQIKPAKKVTKDSMRIGLHLIKQYREQASPSRATMQKLNRFFMSDCHRMDDSGITDG